jgi:tetratricopeptide (TPR) repeat protein
LDLSDAGLLRSEKYELESKDVFVLQEELARQVAQWLAIELLPSAWLIRPNQAASPAAHDAYLKARFFWHQMTSESMRLNPCGSASAIFVKRSLRTRISRRPTPGSLTAMHKWGSIRVALMKPDEALANAWPLIERALELDEGLAEAHCTLGMLKSWYELDWTGAGEDFQRALSVDANSITALIWHALHLSAIGQAQDALSAIKRARELDPLSVIVNTYVGVVYFTFRASCQVFCDPFRASACQLTKNSAAAQI